MPSLLGAFVHSWGMVKTFPCSWSWAPSWAAGGCHAVLCSLYVCTNPNPLQAPHGTLTTSLSTSLFFGHGCSRVVGFRFLGALASPGAGPGPLRGQLDGCHTVPEQCSAAGMCALTLIPCRPPHGTLTTTASTSSSFWALQPKGCRV